MKPDGCCSTGNCFNPAIQSGVLHQGVAFRSPSGDEITAKTPGCYVCIPMLYLTFYVEYLNYALLTGSAKASAQEALNFIKPLIYMNR
jgi:hypothetical protein